MSICDHHQVLENGDSSDKEELLLLPATNDNYEGVIVDLREPMDPDKFTMLLRASLAEWKRQGKKGVWIKLATGLSNLVDSAVKEGFWYHHAEPSHLMLAYWIPKTPCTLPANATHSIGVGAVVLTDNKEILVVQENSGRLKGTGVWKIPTGVVEEGEDIHVAVSREVKEETGIETEFKEIIAFRQTHNSLFGKSDLFFVCLLHPLSFDIKKQELEIEAAQWMPFEEYAAQPYIMKHGPFKCITDICISKADGNYFGFTPQPMKSYTDQISYVYVNSRDLNFSASADKI